MHDALFADQGRLEDPHLWARAERLGLDLARFDADRRVRRRAARVKADFRGGLRAGVADHADAVPRRRAPSRAPGRSAVAAAGEPRRLKRRIPGPMAPPPARDAHLVDRLRTDESGEAMRALYRTYGGELYGFALNALGDRGTAEEIVQEVFLRAWRHADSYDPARAASAPGSTRSRATRSSTRGGAPPCGPALRQHEPRRSSRRAAPRSSRRCSAGRSPPRSSGSRRSTGR